MNCKPVELVGIPFPYSDLVAEKRRPVLVITQEDRYGDFICAAVTSVPATEYAVLIDNTSIPEIVGFRLIDSINRALP